LEGGPKVKDFTAIASINFPNNKGTIKKVLNNPKVELRKKESDEVTNKRN
jgi:hypothetical protein